jgi:citrate synthase
MRASDTPAAQARNPDRRTDYLSREEALDILHIKRQTLYCYVSRGYIRSVPQPDSHASYYLREDVERVKAKSAARSGHGPAAASAMQWGEPVILTAITEITENGPRYRNRFAIDLAHAGASFEAVAEYLWTGNWTDEPVGWRSDSALAEIPELLAATTRLHPRVHVLQLLTQATLSLGIAEGGSERVGAGGTPVLSARRLIRTMAGVFGFLGPGGAYVSLEDGEPVARGLARALGLVPDAANVRALNTALVLVADHELNPATFAARIAASSGADLHSCIGAALDVHNGNAIGLGCDRVEQLFAPPVEPAAVLAAVKLKLDAAQKLTGFNHPLYPHGDPRTQMLIELARDAGGARRMTRNMLESLDRMRAQFEILPGIEAGLVTICRSLGLPDHTAGGLFALSRSAGWVAHILEQRLAGFMIRPRAKFKGAQSPR